jgi:hypothetical protein
MNDGILNRSHEVQAACLLTGQLFKGTSASIVHNTEALRTKLELRNGELLLYYE